MASCSKGHCRFAILRDPGPEVSLRSGRAGSTVRQRKTLSDRASWSCCSPTWSISASTTASAVSIVRRRQPHPARRWNQSGTCRPRRTVHRSRPVRMAVVGRKGLVAAPSCYSNSLPCLVKSRVLLAMHRKSLEAVFKAMMEPARLYCPLCCFSASLAPGIHLRRGPKCTRNIKKDTTVGSVGVACVKFTARIHGTVLESRCLTILSNKKSCPS